MERVICLLIGYACGLFQTSYFYGKINKIDIRNHGSGNAGTTNALRTLGWKAGVLTLLGDIIKCIVAVLLVRIAFSSTYPGMMNLLAMYTGAGAVLGHNYPFYLKFKGGKGIAVTAGLVICTNPWIALICLGMFLILVALTRYVSVGSLVLVVLFAVMVIVFGQSGAFGMEANYLYEMYAITILLMLSAFYMHRENIKRLFNGTENKLKLKK